jgi:hypothetical protein
MANIYEKIYRSLVDGIPQSKIAKSLHKDKGFVSRVVNALIGQGFLRCINPLDKVKFYEPTKKVFKGDVHIVWSTIQRKKTLKMDEGGFFH